MFKINHKGEAMTKTILSPLFLSLRIWHSTKRAPPGWRVSLQDLGTGKRLGFVDLESLFAFFETNGVEETPQTRWMRAKGGNRSSRYENQTRRLIP